MFVDDDNAVDVSDVDKKDVDNNVVRMMFFLMGMIRMSDLSKRTNIP